MAEEIRYHGKYPSTFRDPRNDKSGYPRAMQLVETSDGTGLFFMGKEVFKVKLDPDE
jgi:hypothetical protein